MSRLEWPSEEPEVLIVDDECTVCEILAEFLAREGYSTTTATGGAAALDLLERRSFDVVIADLKMPQIGGLDVMSRVHQTSEDTKVIIMTGLGTVETAIDATRGGAFHYILKPFKAEE
jgi:DNA-binding NtrC family response regulator